MRYTLVLSALVASTIATPYLNLEISEPEDVEIQRGRDHHKGRRDHRHGSFWSSLWNPSQGRGTDDRRDPYDPRNLVDQLFGNNYECIIEGRSKNTERHADRDCCREVGGRLSDLRGHCIIRDMTESPRDDWRECALRDNSVEFADCYFREPREIDHDLDRKRDPNQGRSRNDDDDDDKDSNNRDRNRNGRHGRHGHRDRDNVRDDDRDNHRDNGRDSDRSRSRNRKGHSGRHHRHNDKHQRVLDDGDDRSRREYDCGVSLDNEQQRREIVRNCCERETDNGRLEDNNNICVVDNRDDVRDFEDCALREGARDAQCRRISD